MIRIKTMVGSSILSYFTITSHAHIKIHIIKKEKKANREKKRKGKKEKNVPCVSTESE